MLADNFDNFAGYKGEGQPEVLVGGLGQPQLHQAAGEGAVKAVAKQQATAQRRDHAQVLRASSSSSSAAAALMKQRKFYVYWHKCSKHATRQYQSSIFTGFLISQSFVAKVCSSCPLSNIYFYNRYICSPLASVANWPRGCEALM